MRTRIENPGGKWGDIVKICPFPVDHVHGVIVLEGDEDIEVRTHIVHLSPEGEEMGPQTLMKEGNWGPGDFDSISLDSE